MQEPKLTEEELVGLSDNGKKNIGKNATVATSMNLEIMTARKIRK